MYYLYLFMLGFYNNIKNGLVIVRLFKSLFIYVYKVMCDLINLFFFFYY